LYTYAFCISHICLEAPQTCGQIYIKLGTSEGVADASFMQVLAHVFHDNYFSFRSMTLSLLHFITSC